MISISSNLATKYSPHEKMANTQIKLCDFGLSRVLTNQCLLEMSGTTDFLGKFLV